jgi:glycosyltransferase involved in cell wall biosynthesis
MDELADRCAGFAHIFRAEYCNTYNHPTRSLATCFNWSVSRRVAREWKALRPDVIHLNKQNLEDGLDLVRGATIRGICTIHLTQTACYLNARAAWLRDRIARWELGKFKGFLVPVQERRSAMLSQFLAGHVRTRTVFNGVPAVDVPALKPLREAKRKELGLAAGEFLVLGLGRLVKQKRPFDFLRIAKELHSRWPARKFIWVGDGNLVRSWEGAVAQAGLEDVISCTGWRADVFPYLLAGDLLLHVSEFEGFPLAVIESMAAGLPCVVTRELSAEIPIFKEDNVLFADDIDDLVKKVRDPRALSRIGESGRRLFNEKLSVNTMAESYEQLYLDALRERAVRTV